MPSENRSSRSSSDAALRGASLAFAKQAPPKPAEPDTYSGSNGALAAATKVGSLHNRLQLPKEPPLNGIRSQSFLAANVAASRSPSVSPMHTGSRDLQARTAFPAVSKRRSTSALSRDSSVSSVASAQIPDEQVPRNYARRRGDSKSTVGPKGHEELLDTRPIPLTNAFIGLFENENAKKPPHNQLQVDIPRPSSAKRVPPEIKSPKPIRLSGTFKPNEHKSKCGPTEQPAQVDRSWIQKTKEEKQDGHYSSDDSFVSASDQQNATQSRTSIEASTLRPTSQDLEILLPHKLQKLPVRPPTKRATTPHMTGDSLANAIVASSIASSRAASPAKASAAPPVPARRRHRHSLFSHHHGSPQITRTPSPVRGLKRQTMRKAPQYDEEDDYLPRRGRKHLMKKHPHKHHEGDRKRWRDEITERERKRYLAVWASNKGIHTSNAKVDHHVPSNTAGKDLSDQTVCNLVVRDIFSRSRLEEDVLEEVYDLVNRDNNGGLTREEFVVGLWLIDQRLKGRKLPIKVSPSVWESVSGAGGWKIPKPRH